MVSGHLQVKNKRFHIVLTYRKDGKRFTKWFATNLPVKGNKKRAEEMLIEYRRNFFIPNDDPFELFSEYLIDWLETNKSSIEKTTYATYKNVIHKKISPYFRKKGILLNELKPSDIQSYYSHLLKNGLSPNTVIHYHANIRKALQHAFRIELITSNPADKVCLPKKTKFKTSYYNAKEINQLLQVFKGDVIEIAVLLVVFYGLRRSEVVGLKWSSIDFEHKRIVINNSIVDISGHGMLERVEKEPKNKTSIRSLPLVPIIENALIHHLAEIESNMKLFKSDYNKEYHDYVCVNAKGDLIKPGYISQHFALILKKNEASLKKIRFHDLRHSCASLLLANDVGIKEIQEWLGHATYSTTADLYLHLSTLSKVKSANIMSDNIDIN